MNYTECRAKSKKDMRERLRDMEKKELEGLRFNSDHLHPYHFGPIHQYPLSPSLFLSISNTNYYENFSKLSESYCHADLSSLYT